MGIFVYFLTFVHRTIYWLIKKIIGPLTNMKIIIRCSLAIISFHYIVIFLQHNSCTNGKHITFFPLIFLLCVKHSFLSLWFFTLFLILHNARWSSTFYGESERERVQSLKWHAALQTNKGTSTKMQPQVVYGLSSDGIISPLAPGAGPG